MRNTEEKLVNLNVNGKTYRVSEGRGLLQTCLDLGIEIPYYCYHPDLSIAGNCRMCLVRVEKAPKLVISCATPVVEGMVVDTQGEEVVRTQNSIMEFLLANHPLDCPVCDQAGECKLQDYSYQYGSSIGRFDEDRVVKTTKSFGPHVKYWGSRCIVCTRCVRFTDEISGTGELSVFYRGDHSEIDHFPNKTLDNPLSMNTVDVCPVGALVSSEFLYQARVWNMQEKKSICSECSVGCNTVVGSLEGEIKRILPRRNQEVNQSFMCDYGRLSFDYVLSPGRIRSPLYRGEELSWKESIQKAVQLLSPFKKQSSKLFFLLSLWCDNETLYLIRTLRQDHFPDSSVFFFSRECSEDQVFSKFRISGDKNPNREGVRLLFGDPEKYSINQLNGNKSLFKNKKDSLFFWIGGLPRGGIPELSTDFLHGFQSVISIEHTHSPFSENSDFILPSLTYLEKEGTFINDQSRIQKFLPTIQPFTAAKEECQILEEIRKGLNDQYLEIRSINQIFDAMSQDLNLGISYESLKDQGQSLKSLKNLQNLKQKNPSFERV